MSTAPRRILVVDDDDGVRSALRRTLTRHRYEVLDSADPAKALEVLRQQPVDLVISDNLMPTMNGVQFLSLVRDRHPDVIRILLTGNADMQTAIRAINDGQIYRFLTKPWDDAALKVMLAGACVQLDILREHRRTLANARTYSDRVIVQC